MMVQYILLIVGLSLFFTLILKTCNRESYFTSKYGMLMISILNITPVLFLLISTLNLGWGQLEITADRSTLQPTSIHIALSEPTSNEFSSLKIHWETLFLIISGLGLLYHLLTPIFIYKSIYRTTTKILPSKIPLHLTNGNHTPYLFGFFKPIMVIPESLWQHMTAEEKKAVLAHETAHFKHGDHRAAWSLQLSKGLFFWNPLFYSLVNTIKDAQEYSADHDAVQQFKQPKDYLKAFIQLLERYQNENSHLVTSKMSGSKRQNLKRIEKLTTSNTLAKSYTKLTKFVLISICPTLSLGFIFAASPTTTSTENTTRHQHYSKPEIEQQISQLKKDNQNLMEHLEKSFEQGVYASLDTTPELSEKALEDLKAEKDKLRELLSHSVKKLGELEMLYCKAQLDQSSQHKSVKKASCIECHSQIKTTFKKSPK